MIAISRKENYGTIHLMVLGKQEQEQEQEQEQDKGDSLPEHYRLMTTQITGIAEDRIYLLNQTHGDKIDNTASAGIWEEGDGLYTTEKDRVLVIKTADCMPVFIWSRERPLIANIHSGWRGLQNGIVEKFVREVLRPGEKAAAYIGPCISQGEYEIGEEVAKYFKQSNSLQKHTKEKYLFGLRERQAEILRGYSSIELEMDTTCTRTSENYFSHRAGDKGRNLNLIWMS